MARFRPATIAQGRILQAPADDVFAGAVVGNGDPATLGDDLVVAGGFTSDWDLSFWNSPAGWSVGIFADHAPGSTDRLDQLVDVVEATIYVAEMQVQQVNAGTISLIVDGEPMVEATSFGSFLAVVQAQGAQMSVQVAPSNDFDGTVQAVKVRARVDSGSSERFVIRAETAGQMAMWCAGGANIGFGQYSLNNLVYVAGLSDSNLAIGDSALASLVIGFGNTCSGFESNAGTYQLNYTTTFGFQAGALKNGTSAFGAQAAARHERSTAIGNLTLTDRPDSTAIGDRDLDIQGLGRGIFLKSPNGTGYRITVSDTGELSIVEV